MEEKRRELQLDLAMPARKGTENAAPNRPGRTGNAASGRLRKMKNTAPKTQGRLRRRKRRARRRRRFLMTVAVIAALFLWAVGLFLGDKKSAEVSAVSGNAMEPTALSNPNWTVDYLTPNKYSRPGRALSEVKNIFVHYTANPGTSAAQNRSYFENMKDTHERYASAHFIIGYEGEVIQCVPLGEIAYAVKTRNDDSISIECCYLDEDGRFTQETYDSLVELLTWLLQYYDLDEDAILRHYDCGGKLCPLYYVEHEDEWKRLKADVGERLSAAENERLTGKLPD